MHSGPGSNQPDTTAGRNGRASLSVPSSGPSGELTVLQRLESFRELIRHGNTLLGEVVAYCREAEAAVNQIAADKQHIDQIRADLESARARADAEAEAARNAMSQVEQQARELNQMREELVQARTEVEEFQRSQTENATALERSLEESRQQQKRLEEELIRVRTQSVPSSAMSTRLAEVTAMQEKLRSTEHLLSQTRKDLETERERRNRAMSLIKPKTVDATPATETQGTRSPKP